MFMNTPTPFRHSQNEFQAGERIDPTLRLLIYQDWERIYKGNRVFYGGKGCILRRLSGSRDGPEAL
jgi:hypothetical protein